jgi:dihydrofolate reductase
MGSGAVIVGRRTYDIVNGWNGTHPAHGVPVFVLTEDTPEDVPQGESIFTFITDGAENAVRQAKAVAGDKNVYVVGGANIAQQCVKQGLLDEMQIHLASVLLGDGISLFDHLGVGPIQIEKIRAVDSTNATHLRYRFVK